MPIDVLIQTFNEELNLPHTLDSVVGWANRVFVVDSGSTDATTQIARDRGATLVHHDWEGYARQKNWALANLPWESDWILIIDADEAVSPELKQEILELVSQPAEEVPEAGFLINRVFIFMGRQIRHCGYFPSWNLRLFKRGMARYEDRSVHEHMICDGPVGKLTHLLLHEDRRGLEHFFAKHNRYSTLEARELLENPEPWPGFGELLSNTVKRRRFLKSRVLPHVPMAWAWRFFYMYILRAGFLDGRAGLRLSSLISVYELQIQAKYKELSRLPGRSYGPQALSQSEGSLLPVEETQAPEPSPAALASTRRHAKTPRLRPSMAVADPTRMVVADPDPDVPDSHGTVIYPGAKATDDPREHQKPFGGDRAGKVPVSVLIPTLNEELNLARCLDHLQWADEVVVVDSGSKDRTCEIARAYGAKVIQFHWNGAWPKKKNWALRHAPLDNEWVLIVDADEWIPPEMGAEIGQTISRPEHAGYYVNRKFIFMGRWIKHCGYYPSWNLRLIRRGKGEYERLTEVGNTGSGDNEVHEHVEALGSTGYLQNDMLHFAFPNIHTFMEKHNRYSNWEAAVQFRKSGTSSAAIGTELSKRRRLKNLSRRMPFRPTLRFLYSYIWKAGFLDGQAGYVFCRLLSIYEYLSVAKYKELKRAEDDQRKARSLSKVPAIRWQGFEPAPEPPEASKPAEADDEAGANSERRQPEDAVA